MKEDIELPTFAVILIYCAIAYLSAFVTNQICLMAQNDKAFLDSMYPFQWYMIHCGCLLQTMITLKALVRSKSKREMLDVDPVVKGKEKDEQP